MSLRGRLVLVATAAVAVTVVLASVVVYFLVRNELRGQVDRNLQSQAQQISHSPQLALATPISPKQYLLHIRQTPFGSQFQLVDNKGGVYRPEVGFNLLAPLLPGVSKTRLVASGARSNFYFEENFNHQHVRILAAQLVPGLYAIEVATPLTSVDHELAKIRLWLLLVAVGGVGIASLAGFLVARASLKPVRNLSEAAERVRATRDLTQRIKVDGKDELSRLALTFNAMLESLDDAARRQQQLVQDASHELRTPLTSLRTNIEVLASGDALPPEDREQLLRDVVAQLGEMTALISELTELARGEEHTSALEDVRLDLLTEDAIRRATRNHPDVPIKAELSPASMVGTPASIERAIANLLDNAAKWSPAGSPVEVRLGDGELTVRDHGPGIADADLPHIFERFYRATSARSMPGSGLGLAIVQQVAEAHGGTITAEHAPGGGTLMRLRLAARNGSSPDELS
jgi:two-component system, OmpR family, sensor histidine kinase MprB